MVCPSREVEDGVADEVIFTLLLSSFVWGILHLNLGRHVKLDTYLLGRRVSYSRQSNIFARLYNLYASEQCIQKEK